MSRSEYTKQIIKYFAKQNKKITSNTELFNSGFLDSIDMVELVMFIEEHFEIKLPQNLMTIENFNSLENIVTIIDEIKNN